MTPQAADASWPLRVGVVGAGGIARAHVPAWLASDAQVVIHSLSGAAEMAANHGCRVAASLEELFAECEIVDVCTPTPAHRSIVEQAAAAGKHVFCEKPLARTSPDARAVIDACTRAGVRLYPGHVVRYFHEYAAMHRAVTTGTVGTIAVQRFNRAGSRPQRPWYQDEEQSGGVIMDQLIHDLDFARWNAGEVTTVFARVKTAGGTPSPVSTAQVILTHAGGAMSYANGTWAPPGSTFRTSFDIAGTDGVLRHDSAEHPAVRIDAAAAQSGGTGLLPATRGRSPFAMEIAEVGAAFAGGPPPRVTAEDGLRAVQIAEAAIESSRTGQAVTVGQAGGTDRTEVPA